MVPSSKLVVGLIGTSTTAAATTTANFDTLGYDYAQVAVIMGTANVVSNNPSTLKLAMSDDTEVTNFSDITACVGDGTGGWTIPNSDTSNTNAYLFNVSLVGKKRWLRLSVAPLTTQIISAHAILSRGETAPIVVGDQGTGVLAVINA